MTNQTATAMHNPSDPAGADAASARLAGFGLRLPTAELDAFAALLADMEAAAAIARRPLPYACEPACVFTLRSAGA